MITIELAKKVLETVDMGLCSGLGQAIPGKMCIEAAVCFALGEPHCDEPSCVSPAVRAFKIRLNDSPWSSNAARAAGMRKLAVAQLGSKGAIDETIFCRELAKLTIQRVLPVVLRKAGLTVEADRCEVEGTEESARAAARYAADCAADCAAARAADSARARAAAAAAADSARSALSAARYAAARTALSALSAARSAAAAADSADSAAYSARYAAARYAAAAADSALSAAADSAYSARAAAADSADEILTISADACLDALRFVNAPGVALLDELGIQ